MPIEPALTPEDWAQVDTLREALRGVWWESETGNSVADDAHGCAALCLHGQPYGFTHADVDLLRGLSSQYEVPYCDIGDINNLANRIAALLPPREAAP